MSHVAQKFFLIEKLACMRINPAFRRVPNYRYMHIGSKYNFTFTFLTLSNVSNEQWSQYMKKTFLNLDQPRRNYAKGKNKPKGGGKQTVAHISEEELSEVIRVDKFKQDLERELENMKEDFTKNLSIRSSVGSLETLSVELEGDKYPLSEIAQVIRKSPILVIVNATAFPQAVSNIKKAILESGMNLNPQQEGTTIYIPIPKVTREHRERLVQNAKAICDNTKNNMKEIQNKYIKKIRAQDGEVSEDLVFNAQVKVREMTQQRLSEAESITKNKQNDLIHTNK